MTRKKKYVKSTMIKKAEKALKAAGRRAAQDHRRSGLPLVVWKRGRVVRIPASKI